MTIDEYIAYEREKAKEQRQHIGTWDDEYSKRCKKWAEQHEQLAEWLEDLKEMKSTIQKNLQEQYILGFEDGYKKAVDDFEEKIQWEYLNSCGIKPSEIEFLVNI